MATTLGFHQTIEELLHGFGLTVREFAQPLGVSERTVERWLAGETLPQHDARRRLAELRLLYAHLAETFETPEAIPLWLHGKSRYLGGLTPADAIRVGRIDRVEAALDALDSGTFV